MSSYIKQTVNPDTHEMEDAEWLDNYFGHRIYGVRFPSTGIIYKEDEYEWQHDLEMMSFRAVRHLGGVITRVKTEAGKTIKMTKHEDGRQDVTVEVNSIDVNPQDESTAKAKEVIDTRVLPAIADALIVVTVIHKPTNDHATFRCKRKDVRQNAEELVKVRGGELAEYCLVQNDGENVTVTTL